MAKSNGRTQRPQRTSRNSSKADAETTPEHNDDTEAVEDLQADTTDGAGKTDTEAGADGEADAAADSVGDDEDAAHGAAQESEARTTATDKKSESKNSEAKTAEKSEKPAKDGKDSKSAKKSETAKRASEKSSGAKGSSAKRTARSGNPAKRSQGRKTSTYTSQSGQQTIKPNPSWFLPVLIGLLLVGLLWLVAFYVSQGAFPVEAWGNWNILIGFAFFVAGLIMSTRWR